MKKSYLFASLVLLAASPAFAQTKIGAAGAPDGSAMLEVTSGTANNKGLLLPRMTLTQRNAIPAPATGLMIYNTTANQVQVNTGTPAAPVWAVATATNSGWDLAGNSGTSPATNFIGTTDNQPLLVRTNNTEKMRVTATGAVGIGVASPGTKLHVADTGNVIIRVASSNNAESAIQLGNPNHGIMRNLTASGGGVNDVAVYTSTGAGDADLHLISNPVASSSSNLPLGQFVLKNTGDIGIGTNTPAQKLHVEGTARIATATGTPTTITGRNAAGDVGNVTVGSGLTLTAGTLSAAAITDNTDWNLTGNTGTNPSTNFIGTTDSQSLVIRTDNTEQVRVTAAGNVGINNTNPLSPLSFESATGSKISFFTSGTTNHYGIGVSSNQLNYHVNPGATHTFFAGGINGDGTELMRIQSDGNVGIGTTAPAQTLHVAGTARISTAIGTPTTITGRNATGDIGNVSLGSGLALTGGVLNTTADNADWNLTGNAGTSPATNFIGTSDAQPLVIRTDNTEQVRVTAVGNVGIGTAAPTQTLDVVGTARIRNATGTPTIITGRNAVGDVGNVTLGSGLSLTGGVLNTTAGNTNWNLTGNTGTNPATNFIGTGDAQPLVIRTDNTEQVRVTAAGNMGIGTASPSQKLQVTDTGNASIAITASAGKQMRVLFGSENHGVMRNLTSSGGNANDVALYTSTGSGVGDLHLISNPSVTGSDSLPIDQFVLKSTGNIGIGTNTPARKLHVEGTARIATAIGTPTTITGRNATGDIGNVTVGSGLTLTGGVLTANVSTAGWNLTGNTGTNPATNFIGTSDNQPLVVRTNNTEQVRVMNNGYVGIGTQNPLSKLNVNEGSLSVSTTVDMSSSAIDVINNGSGAGRNDDISIFSYGASTAPSFDMWTARGTASSPQNAQTNDYMGTIRFGTWVNGGQVELNRIQSVYLGNGATQKSRLTFGVNAATPLMTIDSSGYVGIGTISPTARLSVNGPANNTTGTWGIFSDARVKTVDGEYEDGLTTVMKIHPVKFHYNANAPFKSTEQQIGIIAQEMEQIAPYMVSKVKADGFNDLRQYNNQALPYMLVNAIQEQQAQIETLKAKNEQLEAANKVTAQLMERVKQMEQMIGINEIEGTSKVAGK